MRLDSGVADGGFDSTMAGGRSVPRLGFLPTPHSARPNQGILPGQQHSTKEGPPERVYKYYKQQSQLMCP